MLMFEMYSLLGSVVLLLGGWLLAQTRDEHGLPIRSRVTAGEAMASLGLLGALIALPRDLPRETYAGALAGVLLCGLLLVRGAGRLAIGWTSPAEIATSAVGLGWTRPARAVWSVLALAGGLGVAVWLAGRGEPAAGLLGALLVLAPARWWLPWGASRERTRTGIERALAGLLAGGLEWEHHEAALRGAPVRIRFQGDDRAAEVTYPLPPNWKASAEESLEEDLRARLSRWGYWLTHIDASSRVALAESVEPLPSMLPYDGGTASDTGDVTLGMTRLSRQAARAKGRQYGSVEPFVWDARTAAHGLAVGTTGGGKSSVFRVIITSWCRHPDKRVILLDPKAVEFALFKGRRGVMTVTDTVDSMTEALHMIDAEYHRRVRLCTTHGVTAVWNLPPAARPQSWLFVVDEVMDYLDKNAASTEPAKAENEMRAQAIDILNRIFMKARVMDIHGLLAGQRLDKNVLAGRIQNNAPLRILTSVSEAGSSERHMIGLQDVEPESATPGRGVAKSVRLPESEVQFTYLDEAELDDWLPLDGAAEREWTALTQPGVETMTEADSPAASSTAPDQVDGAELAPVAEGPSPDQGDRGSRDGGGLSSPVGATPLPGDADDLDPMEWFVEEEG